MTTTTIKQSKLGTIVDDKCCILKTGYDTYVFNFNANIRSDSDKSDFKMSMGCCKQLPAYIEKCPLTSKSFIDGSLHYKLSLLRTPANKFWLKFNLITITKDDCDKFHLKNGQFPFKTYFNRKGNSEREAIRTFLNKRFYPNITEFNNVTIVDGGCLFIKEIFIDFNSKTFSVNLDDTYGFKEDIVNLIQMNLDEIKEKIFRNYIPKDVEYVF